MKAMLWLVIGIGVVVWLMRSKKPAVAPARPFFREAEVMRQCDYCGVHFPAGEALLASDGRAFCCDEHRLRA